MKMIEELKIKKEDNNGLIKFNHKFIKIIKKILKLF